MLPVVQSILHVGLKGPLANPKRTLWLFTRRVSRDNGGAVFDMFNPQIGEIDCRDDLFPSDLVNLDEFCLTLNKSILEQSLT